MQLAIVYAEAYRNAARTGRDRVINLARGARLAVRVEASGQVTITIMRRGAAVGDTELLIFRRDLGIPGDAIRWPSAGQGYKQIGTVTWHYVAFRWMAEQPAQAQAAGLEHRTK